MSWKIDNLAGKFDDLDKKIDEQHKIAMVFERNTVYMGILNWKPIQLKV